MVCAFYCNTLDMKKRKAAFAGVAAFQIHGLYRGGRVLENVFVQDGKVGTFAHSQYSAAGVLAVHRDQVVYCRRTALPSRSTALASR